MDIKTYNDIMKVIKTFKGPVKECKNSVCRQFPDVNFLTLFSLVQTEAVRKSKANFHRLPNILKKCLDQFEEAKQSDTFLTTDGILANLAKKYDISPLVLAKEILKTVLKIEDSSVNLYIRDTALINDPKIAFEVYLCLIADDQNGPISDLIKQNFGAEYEYRLLKVLTDSGICFKTECELKEIGYDKTPDFRLLIPIAINGFVINWIESKAIFGCEYSHELFKNKQYSSYYNRFGPGLIIYWFNYIETLTKHTHDKWMIADNFPTDFVTIS